MSIIDPPLGSQTSSDFRIEKTERPEGNDFCRQKTRMGKILRATSNGSQRLIGF